MKKFLSLILFVLSSVFTFAQQFTANYFFQSGDTSSLGVATSLQPFENIVSQRSTTYVWDFSSETWSAPVTPYVFRPASQSAHTLFANSGINEYSNLSTPRDLFFSYSANNDTLFFDGYFDMNNVVYKPHVPYFIFPLVPNDSTYSYTKQYANSGTPNVATGSVSRFWSFDAFGNLVLPYGIISNTVRIRTVQTDSVYNPASVKVTEELMWFRLSDGISVLRFVKGGSSVKAYYASVNSFNAIAAIENDKNAISVYPNPFANTLRINTSGKETIASVEIYDLLGKIKIKETNTPKLINASELAGGVYFIEITTDSKQVYKQRIVK